MEGLPSQPTMIDVMTKLPATKINIFDHGFVELIDCMPRLVPINKMTCEHRICDAARVSYSNDGLIKSKVADAGLVKYLQRHLHTSPSEMVEFTFRMKLPLFLIQQVLRHRTANVNQESRRYTEAPLEYFHPTRIDTKQCPGSAIRLKATDNKQCSQVDDSPATTDNYPDRLILYEEIEGLLDQIHTKYRKLLELGESHETARFCLPVASYSTMYWKMDLHNLLHFIQLRADRNAQTEIQVLAKALISLIEPLVPVSMQTFRDSRVSSVTLTGPEIEALSRGSRILPGASQREKDEFEAKLIHLCLSSNLWTVKESDFDE